jgi:cytochrome c6
MQKPISNRVKLIVASVPFSFVIAVVFAAAPNAKMAAHVPVGSTPMISDGASDYAASCSRCHGSDGRGQTAKGKQTHAGDLTKSNVSDAKGIRMITNGSGEMPAFKSSLTPAQIRAVMAYTRGFRR